MASDIFSFLSDTLAFSIVLVVKGGQGKMSKSLLRTDKEIAEIYKRHSKTVYRVCFAYMKNPADTEDAVQDTFFQLIKSGPAFESEEHENIEDFYNLPSSENIETDDIFQVVMELPEKYKTVVYLYYYEGYTSVEIAGILKKPQSTIRNYLHEARAILKERLGDDFDEEQ